MALNKSDVSALYVAIFNRASEGAGNTFWQGYSTSATSAEIADIMLGTDDAKVYFGDSLDSDQAFIEHIYLNTLGKTVAEDEAGVAFWVDELATKSRGEVVARLIEAAMDPQYAGSDAQNLFLNMVAVSDYAADTISETPDDLAVLRFDAGLEGVTADDASVEATKAKVDQVLNPVDPVDPVVAALEGLTAATKGKADFLKEADTTDAAIAADVGNKIAALAAGPEPLVTGLKYTVGATDNDSDNVIAAKITDQENVNSTNLTTAETALVEAQTEVAKVQGLAAAIELLNARVDTQEGTAAVLLNADADQAAAVASYETLNSGVTVAFPPFVAPAGPTVADDNGVLIVTGTNGRLQLASGVTETAKPGVGALLTAVQAQLDAASINSAALEAVGAARIAIGYLDADKTLKDDIGNAFGTPITVTADADKLTYAEIQVELNGLKAAAETEAEAAGVELEFDGAGLIAPAPAVGSEGEAFNTLKAAVNAFENLFAADAELLQTVHTEDLLVKQGEVADAEKAIEDLTDALAALDEARDLKAQLDDRDQAIADALDVFEELGLEAPAQVTTGTVASAENDLFVLSGDDGSIFNFGAQGEDKLYIGDNFTLVTLGADQLITQRVGDAAEFEVFIKQVGVNAVLYVEQQTFAGNATNTDDIVTVTLNGVSATDLVLEDGFLSIA